MRPIALRASVTADSPVVTGGEVKVLIDGAETAIFANGLTRYTPTPGDRLLVGRVGTQVEVLQFLSVGTVPGQGNTTYRQASQPAGGDYIEGDLWFDTDDGNRVYRWDGAAWVSSQVSGNAIAASGVGTAQVADAAITTAKIDTLIVDKTIEGGLFRTGPAGSTRVEITDSGTTGVVRFYSGATLAATLSALTAGGVAALDIKTVGGRGIRILDGSAAHVEMTGRVKIGDGTAFSHIDWGFQQVSTDANGNFSVLHLLAVTPTAAILTPSSASVHLQTTGFDTLAVDGIARWATGANIGDPVASQNIFVNWIAFKD